MRNWLLIGVAVLCGCAGVKEKMQKQEAKQELYNLPIYDVPCTLVDAGRVATESVEVQPGVWAHREVKSNTKVKIGGEYYDTAVSGVFALGTNASAGDACVCGVRLDPKTHAIVNVVNAIKPFRPKK